MISSRARGLTLVEVLVVVIVLLIAAALLLPLGSQAARRDKIARCMGNLKALHAAQAAAGPPGPNLGTAYWLRLKDRVSPETLRCPLVDRPEAPECLYLGPRTDPAELRDVHPIGADAEINHSSNGRQGGNVLLKSGEVQTEKGDSLFWGDVRSKYCRP